MERDEGNENIMTPLPENACSPTEQTLVFCRSIERSAVHPKKAWWPITFSSLQNLKLLIRQHNLKLSSPIDNSLEPSGISILIRLVHLKNAHFPISSMFVDKVTRPSEKH